MKAVTITLLMAAGLANVAVAQFGTLPTCATECLKNFGTGQTIAGCSQFDYECICTNGSFLDGIACCLVSTCTQAEQEEAVKFANNLCSTAGVTNLPPAVSCSTGGGASSTTSSSSSSTKKSTETEATPTTPISPAETTAGGATGASSPSVTPPASESTGSESSPTETPPTSTNAASHNMAAMGAGLIGGLAAVAAFL